MVISIETDMALPGQVDTLRVQVESRGVIRLDQDYSVGEHDQRIPATLTLIASDDDPKAPVTVRMVGSKQGKPRTYRETTTVVPTARSAALRMPIQWLCDGTARTIPARDGNNLAQDAESMCGEGHTCKAGRCVEAVLEEPSLPDFMPELVWGGATTPEQGVCFDTVACMLQGSVVQPDAGCRIPRPQHDSINVALRVTGGGICDDSETNCFVPLDAESDEGWFTDGDALQLPPAVCDKLTDHSIGAVYVSTECQSKTAVFPPCGKWSSVPRAQPITSASAVRERPAVSLIASLLKDGGSSATCCPLMADEDVLYTCVCDGKTDSADLVAVDLDDPRPEVVDELALAPDRNSLGVATTIADGSLYLAADRELLTQPLPPASGRGESFDVPGSIYESTSLLADSTALYMLASGVDVGGGMMSSPVQLLRLSTRGMVTTFDLGATSPVYQFGQEGSYVYLAVVNDTTTRSGEIRRSSSVARVNKQSGGRMDISPTRTLTVEDIFHGGYTGVQVSRSVFALFEGALDEDGRRTMQVHAFATDGSDALDEPAPLLDITIDPESTQLLLIGAAEGVPILCRVEYQTSDEGVREVRGGSVFYLPSAEVDAGEESAMRAPVTIADFRTDYALQGMVSDYENIYWLNSSGKLYAYPREALE